uniref:ZOT protein n=2 Tax=unclassified Inovirus TaxID=356623 RepID=A0AAU8B5W1_9VIRU
MAVYLITGKPGSFKSAFVMDIALQHIEEGRLVYFCNYRGLKAEKYGLNVLEHPNQWVEQEYQPGTVFIVDELQEFTREVPTNAKSEELPKWFTLLEKHRHLGYDFYVITQHPMFIHTHIRRVLEKHYHMQRAEGLPFANRREWQQICNEPENIDNASIKKGCTVSIYKPPKKVFDYYESTKEDTHKLRIPKKLIKYIIMLCIAIGIILYLGTPVFKKYILNNGSSQPKTETTTPNASNAPQSANNPYDGMVVLDQEKITLKEKILTLQQEINTMKEQQTQSQIIDYDPNHPLQDLDYSYTAVSKPHLAGCIKTNAQCECFTQQGSKLKVSQADCKAIIKDGLPFNPLKPQPQQNPSQNMRYNQSNATTPLTQQHAQQNTPLSNANHASSVSTTDENISVIPANYY